MNQKYFLEFFVPNFKIKVPHWCDFRDRLHTIIAIAPLSIYLSVLSTPTYFHGLVCEGFTPTFLTSFSP
jgi:hypothetical protein